MKKRILLVEPGYDSYYPPLGLMKISTWHKKKKDLVQFVKHNHGNPDFFGATPPKLAKCYDKIYITSLFTYHAKEVIKAVRYYRELFPRAEIKVGGILASLLPDYIEQKTGICPHVGLLDGAENCKPDYDLFKNLQCSITFTTRGCKRKCKFCAVAKHEPTFFIREDWEKDIDPNKKKIIFWDNNWLFSPNFVEDIEKLKKLDKSFDFNQGLDCRLFDEEKAKLLSRTKIKPLRFAFDNHSEDGHIQKAVKLAQKYGFKDIRVYVLYNSEDSNDTPDYFFYRIKEINKLKALSYPMRYRPINSLNRRYISSTWDRVLLRSLKLTLMFYYTKGMITRSRSSFETMYGRSTKQFKEKLKKIYEHDRELKAKRFGIEYHKVDFRDSSEVQTHIQEVCYAKAKKV